MVLLIVCAASECGMMSSNYLELNHLYSKLNDQGLEILAFRCIQFAMRSQPATWRSWASTSNIQFFIFSSHVAHSLHRLHIFHEMCMLLCHLSLKQLVSAHPHIPHSLRPDQTIYFCCVVSPVLCHMLAGVGPSNQAAGGSLRSDPCNGSQLLID